MALEFFPPVQGGVRGPRFCGFKHLVAEPSEAVSTWRVFCRIGNNPSKTVSPGMVFPYTNHALLETFAAPVVKNAASS